MYVKGGLVGALISLEHLMLYYKCFSRYASVTVTITNPPDVGGGSITGYVVMLFEYEDATFAVTVVSSGGNKYAIDGSTQATLTLYKGHTYIFDQSDGNSGHPLRLSTTSTGSHGGGSEWYYRCNNKWY